MFLSFNIMFTAYECHCIHSNFGNHLSVFLSVPRKPMTFITVLPATFKAVTCSSFKYSIPSFGSVDNACRPAMLTTYPAPSIHSPSSQRLRAWTSVKKSSSKTSPLPWRRAPTVDRKSVSAYRWCTSVWCTGRRRNPGSSLHQCTELPSSSPVHWPDRFARKSIKGRSPWKKIQVRLLDCWWNRIVFISDLGIYC